MLPFCSELCPVTCCRCCYGFKRIYTLICLIVPGFWTSVPEEKGDVLTVFVTLLTIHQHFCDVHMPFHRKDFLLYLPTKQNKLNEIFTILQLERFSKYCHGLFREKSFCRYGCNIADQYLCKKFASHVEPLMHLTSDCSYITTRTEQLKSVFREICILSSVL